MFEYLQELDPRLYERYLTVERNIKSASNSFYDSYLDLQEQFVKMVLIAKNVELNANETCGAMLRRPEAKECFMSVLGVDDNTYNKMQDYTLKVNAHKHKGEKKIMVDTIVSYMEVFYSATSAYCREYGIECGEYQENNIIKMFDFFSKENKILRKKQATLLEELSRMADTGGLKDSDVVYLRGLLSQNEMDGLSEEDQNSELYRQISGLMEIKLNSMEEKLNQTIDLLLELKPAIVENRIITRAVGNGVGHLINGKEDNVERWIQAENDKKDTT